jgi:hypothetical protein
MFMPGGGMNPKIRCFGCGECGHRKGDAGLGLMIGTIAAHPSSSRR